VRLVALAVFGMFVVVGCASSEDAVVAEVRESVATTAPLQVEPTVSAVDDMPTAVTVPTAVPLPTLVPAPTAVPAPATSAPAMQPTPAPGTQSTSAPAATAAPVVSGSQEVLAANGAEVYTLRCARCHGENGLGSAQVGQYSAGLINVGSKYSTSAMIEELTNGHPVTFGFADRLSAEEIASVVAYVKATFP